MNTQCSAGRWPWPPARTGGTAGPSCFMAGAAAALPDWDGLSLAFGPAAYSAAHRVWGHNLLAALLGGGLVGALGYLCHHSARVRGQARTLLEKLGQPPAAPQP